MNLTTEKGKFFRSKLFIVVAVLLATVGFSVSNVLLAEEEMVTDQRGDLKDCYSIESSCSSCSLRPPADEMGDELPFIDILEASIRKTKGSNSLLLMKLKLADSVPTTPSLLTLYSFALDLDGDPDTGFRADQSPLGVFPDLGVDLWVNFSLNRGVEDTFLFIGPKNIKDLNNTTGLLEYSYKQERQTVSFTVPVKPVERKLTFAYLHKTDDFKVELENMEWVAFTSKTTPHHSADNPICDFHPDKYFEENPEGCLLKTPAPG